MKKLIILSIGAVVLMANFSSCKKGENDPFLSLKSRKARLTGEWTVTNEVGTSAWASGGLVFTETSTYNGTTHSAASTTTLSGTVIDTDAYSYTRTSTFTFEKDGTFEMVTTYPTWPRTETSEGTWAFACKSKTAELKNKEAIIITVLTYTVNDDGDITTETETGFNNSMVLVIDQLKSKEIIFINESSYIDSDGDTGSETTTTTLTAD